MKTKKLLALLMAGAMSVSVLSGCGGSAAKTDDSSADAADTSASAESDVDYVKGKGKLVVGITEFEPMDYQNESGEWIGFDADMAKMAADPATQRWWDVVKPLMSPLPDRAEGEFWSDMEEIYHLN